MYSRYGIRPFVNNFFFHVMQCVDNILFFPFFEAHNCKTGNLRSVQLLECLFLAPALPSASSCSSTRISIITFFLSFFLFLFFPPLPFSPLSSF